jgi:triosephosphate isomerase
MKKLIVGNWKLNPKTLREAKSIFEKIKKSASRRKKVEVVLCPSFLYLESFVKNSGQCFIGAQDVFWEEEGAFTGQISASQLSDLGVSYVIIGHSERREYGGDTNEQINKKILEALRFRLRVIFCIGEVARDEEGNYLTFLAKELEEGLFKVPEKFYKNLVIAYEPIWAIGEKGKASTPEDFLEKSIFIKKVLTGIVDKKTALKVPVLYGGSVDENNAEEFMSLGKGDGLLVGRASLDPKSFNEILNKGEHV